MKYVKMKLGERVYRSKGHQFSDDFGETWRLTINEGGLMTRGFCDGLMYRRPVGTKTVKMYHVKQGGLGWLIKKRGLRYGNLIASHIPTRKLARIMCDALNRAGVESK